MTTVAILDKKKLHVFKQDELVLEGNRNRSDGLWDVPFPDVKVNYIIQKDQIKVELTQYLHGCAFSPSISTFQTAINRGNFITWPGIEEIKFKSILGSPLVTTLSHLDQE